MNNNSKRVPSDAPVCGLVGSKVKQDICTNKAAHVALESGIDTTESLVLPYEMMIATWLVRHRRSTDQPGKSAPCSDWTLAERPEALRRRRGGPEGAGSDSLSYGQDKLGLGGRPPVHPASRLTNYTGICLRSTVISRTRISEIAHAKFRQWPLFSAMRDSDDHLPHGTKGAHGAWSSNVRRRTAGTRGRRAAAGTGRSTSVAG